MKNKRMNRKKIVSEFESFRNLCLDIMTDAKTRGDELMVTCYRAHHDIADKMIVELGGESTKELVDQIQDGWKELDKQKKRDESGEDL